MSNVVPLQQLADQALSRNRKEALATIAARLRVLLFKDGAQVQTSGRPATSAHIAGLHIVATHTTEDIVFTIYDGRVRVMTGHLTPNGAADVMLWKRGNWEARLFTEA